MNECVKKKLDLNSAIIRNAEALGGKNVSRDAVKKVSFQSQLPGCPAVSSKRSVQRQRKHGWQKLFAFEERPASVRGLTAVVERGRVVRAVTEGMLVSMSILPCSIQFVSNTLTHG